ncbi:hypothetical protein OLMES_4961 [Oleiphilus messinensis]|uniref:SnoaL-like domain-containing protein n=1 Tax=Oleiphilus messinensis TaxID=141451 RepID=A0A1Y0IFP3_9GAMM|nr:nuclear transport factor 2 family protein [Oleiphilus messinensis]ARU58949.1 hypothetical protein OLMES_4961 [Oleiphilus messinensis]
MTQIDLAVKYYQALYSGEHDIVRSIAFPDMVFEDPSAPHEFGIPPQIDELETFLSFMEANLLGEVEIHFTDNYVSNDRVVLIVSSKGIVPASRVDMGEEGTVKYASRGVSVLHIVDGKVKRHTDYFNYPALAGSFKRLD